MSVKSNKHAGRTGKGRKAIDRPFDPAVLKRAGALGARYRIVLEPQPDHSYFGYCLEMPLVMGDGPTPDACVESTRRGIEGVVAYMLENGEIPPSPASDEKRDQQVNIRLTIEEKSLLEENARQNGFRGVSDYVRSKTFADLT